MKHEDLKKLIELKEGHTLEFKESLTKEIKSYEQRLGDKLGDVERKIIDVIRLDSSVSISILAKELGISTTAIENNLKKLKEKGFIMRVGGAKGGHWELRRK